MLPPRMARGMARGSRAMTAMRVRNRDETLKRTPFESRKQEWHARLRMP